MVHKFSFSHLRIGSNITSTFAYKNAKNSIFLRDFNGFFFKGLYSISERVSAGLRVLPCLWLRLDQIPGSAYGSLLTVAPDQRVRMHLHAAQTQNFLRHKLISLNKCYAIYDSVAEMHVLCSSAKYHSK